MHTRYYPGLKTDTPPGGVSWWFKQDEIHQATHVHGGPEFLPWHRELMNRFEGLLRQINPQLSLHYWDFTQDPTNVPDGNRGGGLVGPLNLFDSSFFGSAIANPGDSADPNAFGANVDAGDPWRLANFYDPLAGTPPVPGQPNHPPFRGAFDGDPAGTNNPADFPRHMARTKPAGQGAFSSTAAENNIITNNSTYPAFRLALEGLHNSAHGYLASVSPHVAFRDPLVFLLHSNVDRIFARWQTDPAHPERMNPTNVYGTEPNQLPNGDVPSPDGIQNLNRNVEPWSTGAGQFHSIRPWEPTHEHEGAPHTYRDISIVTPPRYDTNYVSSDWSWLNMDKPQAANIRARMGAVTAMDTPASPQRPHVFVECNDFNLWCRWSDGAAWHWLNMGKPQGANIIASVGAVTVMNTPTSPQRPHVFVVGNDRNLWCRWSDGAAWSWLNMGKPQGANIRTPMGAVTVMNTPTSPQRSHVFVEGNDFNLWCLWSKG
jgi:hypothetical protein